MNMSKIIFHKGDLLDTTKGIILHQVNCLGVMGSGVALQIKERYPEAYKEYIGVCNWNTPENLLGELQIVKITDDISIANIFGQLRYGYGEMHTDYEAVRSSLEKLAEYIDNRNDINTDDITHISLPYRMGCDRGGGNWVTYFEIIQECLMNTKNTVNIHVYKRE